MSVRASVVAISARYDGFRTFCFRMWSYAGAMAPNDDSPTARALLALELIQGSPGITASRLAERLGVTERAARRYVAILREAGIPLESVRGPYGGYRVGRGLLRARNAVIHRHRRRGLGAS